MGEAIDFEQEITKLTDYWSPHVVGRLNGDYVKVAKVLGTFTWHKHDGQDELFLVLRGKLRIQLEGDREVAIEAGQFYVVPQGVLHCPVAEEEVWLALIEPMDTAHTGDVVSEFTRSVDEQLAGT